jgi:hypothetical protein
MSQSISPRTGLTKAHMLADTLAKIKGVLSQAQPPKCIFVVHGHKSQLSEIIDAITQEKELYKYGDRKIFALHETDSSDKANDFLKEHRASISGAEGWIFVSHRGVARGVDINGPEPATMIINFRFANASELEQALGRGNRNPQVLASVTSHVFTDAGTSITLQLQKTSGLANV